MEPPRAEREGLPRGYRMRADTHYVEHLASPSAGQAVRMIAVDQFASPQSFDPLDSRPLVESIRTHGIVHPLLIRRRETGYGVIAGHKRLAAARLLRLPTIPCLVHDVEEGQAILLARADNLHAVSPAQSDTPASMVGAVQQAIAQHLAIVQAGVALISTSLPRPARATVDLVAAHSWRAARLVEVTDVIAKRPAPPARMRALASVIDRVVDGFAAEGRVNGVEVGASIEGVAAGIAVNEHDVSLILSSGVLATLPLLEHARVDRPAIAITASSETTGSVRIVIAQTAAPAPAALARRFFDEASSDRTGGWCAVACALAVKTVAERAGGAADFDVDAHGHTSLSVGFQHAWHVQPEAVV